MPGPVSVAHKAQGVGMDADGADPEFLDRRCHRGEREDVGRPCCRGVHVGALQGVVLFQRP